MREQKNKFIIQFISPVDEILNKLSQSTEGSREEKGLRQELASLAFNEDIGSSARALPLIKELATN